MQDFFISYNHADEAWARGIGDWLDQAGFTTILQAADFVAGSNFVSAIHSALEQSQRMILVLSPDYLSARFPEAEWTAAFAKDPIGERCTLVPVRVRECEPGGLLKAIVYIDLVGLGVEQAKSRFLAEIKAMLGGKRVTRERPVSIPTTRAKRSKMTQSVAGSQNTAVQAGHITHLTIKTGSRKAPSVQPLDRVGANTEMRAYIEYLIDRYIDWRMEGIKKGKDKRPFHPSMIHRDVKRDFGARTYLVPKRRFPELAEYLQNRIDDTIKGRNNTHRNYHTFEEHVQLLNGKSQNYSAGEDSAPG